MQNKFDQTAPEHDCPRCHGTGKNPADAIIRPNGPCYECEGKGKFTRPDVSAIIAQIKGRKGLCSKRPADRRAYYVWRNARFHGGKDVTMPVTAMFTLGNDPYRPTLDTIADAVARKVYGNDIAAAMRWGSALGLISHVPESLNLPVTAYPNGPAVLGEKPLEEAAELR